VIKSFVPHCFHGRDKSGRLVMYQKPGDMRLAMLAAHGLNLPMFMAHYIFMEEYLAKVGVVDTRRPTPWVHFPHHHHPSPLLTGSLPTLFWRAWLPFLSQCVYKTNDDAVVKVIDLGGLRRADLTPELRSLMRTSLNLGKHYPGRTARLILINKPLWASILLAFIKGILSGQEAKKVTAPALRFLGLFFVEKPPPLTHVLARDVCARVRSS